MKKAVEVPINVDKMLKRMTDLIPVITNAKHKGQYGRIGVVGGCLEYSGAPYYAAMTALKCGADIAHIFCHEHAASAIKCYSPDLIVHPILGKEQTCKLMEPWLNRLHTIVIGPGVGTDLATVQSVKDIIDMCQRMNMPTVIDADGLAIIKSQMGTKAYRNMILTPNVNEFRRLFGEDDRTVQKKMPLLGNEVTILVKGLHDKIYVPRTSETHIWEQSGSGRRCGGQGDMLSGALGIFFYWANSSHVVDAPVLATFAACYLIKECNKAAFAKFGRSMLTNDMLQEVYNVFRENFRDD